MSTVRGSVEPHTPAVWMQHALSAFAVFAVGLAVRLVNLTGFRTLTEYDTAFNTSGAHDFITAGLLGPDNWWTQPLKAYTMAASLGLFGDDLLGARMRGALLGVVVCLLVYAATWSFSRSRHAALAAGLLVALDPLSIAYSRSTSEDTQAAVLLLVALLLWRRCARGDDWLSRVAFGVVSGLAVATRWYCVVPLLVMGAALVPLRARSMGRLAAFMSALTDALVTPLCVYVLAYAPWIMRGYSLAEFWALQLDALKIQSGAGFGAIGERLLPLARPARWFFAWLGGTERMTTTDTTLTVGATLNDPVLWATFLPAAGYLAWRGWRSKRWDLVVLIACFLGLYVFFVTAQRPILPYSAVPVVALGFVVAMTALSRAPGRWLEYTSAAAVVWSLYLLPLTTAIPVPLALYGWATRAIIIVSGGG